MRKVYDPQSNANVFYLDTPKREQISVTEIGRAEPPAGFFTRNDRTNCTLISYIFSGSCSFKGVVVTSPAIIATRPGEILEYTVCENCNDFLVYWIKCCGDISGELLSESGFYSDDRVLPFVYADKAKSLFELITNEESYSNENEELYMTGALFRLLSLHSGRLPQKEISQISPYTQTVLDHIHSNYSSQITEKNMASLVNLSTNYMHKIFLSDMKMTPIYYLNHYRIKQSKKLLKETDLPISAIAVAVGISGGDYFCRVFRKYNGGISPTEYRKRIRVQTVPKN